MIQVRLVLASASPRRSELLTRAGLNFEVRVSDIREEVPLTAETPSEVAEHLAFLKAEAVARRLKGKLVLGADTVIDLNGELMGKPANEGEAVEMLQKLSGREHQVITGITVMDSDNGKGETRSVATFVRMKEMEKGEILEYVRSREPMDKAGAYAIQGSGSRFIESIWGCYNNVVGLPLCEVETLLRRTGVGFGTAGICRDPSGDPCPRSL